MDNKKTITIIILGLVAIAGILLFLFLPSKSHLANIAFQLGFSGVYVALQFSFGIGNRAV